MPDAVPDKPKAPHASRAAEVMKLASDLHAERDRLLAELDDRQRLEHESADDVSEPRDAADFGTVQNDIDRFEALANRSARRLDAIQEALARVAQGRFGICASCSGRIAIGRLRTMPETTLCAECAAEAERAARRA
jgi:DnaK suppressor protein